MKKLLMFIAVFIFIDGTNVFSQSSTTWKTLEINNYTINYPSDKHLIKNSQEGTFTLYLNQRDNLSMEINDLAGYDLSLSEFSRQYLEHLQSQYNTKVLQNIRVTIGNQPCQKIICAYDDGHGEIKLKAMYGIWVKNNWAYTLSLTSAPVNFDEWKPVAQKVMDSFKIIK